MGAKEAPTQSFTNELWEAIEKDDIKAFAGCMEKYPCGSFRFGRFPVLSALYLCGSSKILKAYESQFISVSSWQALSEPISLATKFRKTAGKCLRLYLDEVVTPPEMLAITEQTPKLKNKFTKFRLSSAAKQRVKDIYTIKYGLEVVYEGNGAYFPRRPINRREKRMILFACAGALIIAASAVSLPFIVNEFSPFIKDGNGALRVSSAEQIDFNSDNTYILKKDISLSKDFYRAKLKCTIDGNGKTINFAGEKSAVGMLSGTIKNAVIKTSASVPLIDTVDIPGKVENVTVKANSDFEVSENFAYLVNDNYGTLDGVTLYAEGSVAVSVDQTVISDSVFIGGIAATNSSYSYFLNTYYGAVKNCKAVYTDFSLEGVICANTTSFGGIVGENMGVISSSVTEGKISSDTVDLGGICGTNHYLVDGCQNKASIAQISDNTVWRPVCGGIAIENYGPITYCVNYGKISSTAIGEACAGGICGQAYGEIYYCMSECEIAVSGKEAYAGGIAGLSAAQVVNDTYVCFGFSEYCISDCSISAASDNAFIGGITGFIGTGQINYLYPNNETVTVYYGGAIYCLSLSDFTVSGNGYFGSIAGVCGSSLTGDENSVNSFIWNNVTYDSLKGNVFSNSDVALNAIGATYTVNSGGVNIYGEESNVGATLDTKANIKGSDLYAQIIAKLNGKTDK